MEPIAPTDVWQKIGEEAGLQSLLRHFYADVRQDQALGPIFNARIHDWPSHLEKIGAFWKRQLGQPSRYPGGFAAAHLSLGIEELHFQRWLGLWERNCRQHLVPDAADWLIGRAHEIATQLRRVLCGIPTLQVGSSPAR